jgi:ATP-dependent metalloprotease FtsH
MYAVLREGTTNISLVDAEKTIIMGDVDHATMDGEYTYLYTKKGEVLKIQTVRLDKEMMSHLSIESKKSYGWLWLVVFIAIIMGAMGWVYNTRRIDALSNEEATGDKSKKSASCESPISQNLTPVKSTVCFGDIGGIGEVKEELEEIIDFLRNPKRYYNFGARMPRGVLLVGPPGVGKTMIAKAVAHEADVPFFYQSGASFVQIYVGMGAKRVSELFAAAKKNAPAIIFIDEIDAVGKKRGGERNDEREGTLNQLLTEMDGFEDTSGIIVIAATNNIEVMDSALLRAGRFDRRVFVELPTATEREAILEKYLRHIPHDLNVAEVARMTVGFNGAALAALVNEAALLCLRTREIQVTMHHFLLMKDKVMFGKKQLAVLSEKQRHYQARYQAGKVFAAIWFDLAFEKITLSNDTITPPTAEPLLQHEIEAHIRIHLAGMVACELRFGEHASNASHDLEVARDLATSMIEKYGMGTSLLPQAQDIGALLERLQQETRILLERYSLSLDRLEAILNEYEQISKALAKETVQREAE